MSHTLYPLTLTTIFLILLSPSSYAQNAEFQDFFFDVCRNPTEALAVRCGQTENGAGNLSSNSESSLNPNQSVSVHRAPLADARNQMRRAQERLSASGAGQKSVGEAVLAGPFSLLVNGNYTWFDQDAGVGERGFDGDATTFELGLDYRLSDRAVAGGFLGYRRSESEFDQDATGTNFTPQNNSGTTDVDTVSAVLFGSYDLSDQLYLEGSVGLSGSDYEFRRNVVFQESSRLVPQTDVRTRGEPEGTAYWISGNIGYRFNRGALSFTPYLRGSYIRSDIDGFRERDLNGSGLAMDFDDTDRSSLTSTLGFRGTYAIGTGWGVVLPQMDVEWEHEFDEDAETSTSAFVLDADDNQYRIAGDDPDRNYYRIGLGLVAVFPHGWNAFAYYRSLVSYEDRDREQLLLGLRKEF